MDGEKISQGEKRSDKVLHTTCKYNATRQTNGRLGEDQPVARHTHANLYVEFERSLHARLAPEISIFIARVVELGTT